MRVNALTPGHPCLYRYRIQDVPGNADEFTQSAQG